MGKYNTLSRLLVTNRRYVIARATEIIRQLNHYATLPDLTDTEQFWLEVIRESFGELIHKACATP